jgi:fructokinase
MMIGLPGCHWNGVPQPPCRLHRTHTRPHRCHCVERSRGSWGCSLADRAPASTLVLVDPHRRPSAIPDIELHRRTIEPLAEPADIVKFSVEDVAVVCPAEELLRYAVDLAEHGPTAAVATDGPHDLRLLTRDGLRSIATPKVDVVDTIGAGDALAARLLRRLARPSDFALRPATVAVWQHAMEAALSVAAAVCTSRGVTLPDGFTWACGTEW